MKDSNLKNIYFVTEPVEILISSFFLSKELLAASSWSDYHGDLNRAISMLSIKCKGSETDLEDQTILTKRLKKSPSKSDNSHIGQLFLPSSTTSTSLSPRTKRRSPAKFSATYDRSPKGKVSSGAKIVSQTPLSMLGLDESSLVDVKVLNDDSDAHRNSLKGVVVAHKQPQESC